MSRQQPSEKRNARLANAGIWPNKCRCGLTMQFAYGPGETVSERAAGAYRRCNCGRTVTARDVMKNRGGHIER